VSSPRKRQNIINDPKSEILTWKEDQINDASRTFQLSAAVSVHIATESQLHEKAGTIIVVRTTGSFSESSMDGGVRSQALSKVRWSKPILVDKEICYATGLKYVTVD
jgi:hypothetical protein